MVSTIAGKSRWRWIPRVKKYGITRIRLAPRATRRLMASSRLGRASRKAVATRSNFPATSAACATATTAWLADETLEPCAKMTIPQLTATMSIARYVKKTPGSAGRHGDGGFSRPGVRFDGRGQPGHLGGRRAGGTGVLHRSSARRTGGLSPNRENGGTLWLSVRVAAPL